jgi:hypothetical protein
VKANTPSMRDSSAHCSVLGYIEERARIQCTFFNLAKYNPRDQWDEHLSAGRLGPSPMTVL